MSVSVALVRRGGVPVVEAVNRCGMPVSVGANKLGLPVTPALRGIPVVGTGLPPGAMAGYDFRLGSYYGPPLTCVRASSAYVEDLAGNWTLVPANTLRRSNKGVLVEESRTNSIRNNAMQGAVVGAPGTRPTNWAIAPIGNIGTLVANVVGLGTESGIDYIDVRLVGTSTGVGYLSVTFGVAQEAAASSGQTWTASAFVSIVGGTTVNANNPFLGIDEYSAANAFLANSSSPVVLATGALGSRRFSHTRTLNSASTAGTRPFFGVNYVAGAVDITLRIGWPQLEQGAFATSPIRTTGIAATRAADVITAPLSGLSAATLVAIGQHVVGSSGNNHSLASISDGTFNNRLIAYRSPSPGNMIATQWTGGAAASALGGVVNPNTRFAVASAFAANDRAMSVNGAAVAADAFALSFPSGLSQVQIGMNGASSGQWNGFIERVVVLPYRATNADVQRLSQLSTWGG